MSGFCHRDLAQKPNHTIRTHRIGAPITIATIATTQVISIGRMSATQRVCPTCGGEKIRKDYPSGTYWTCPPCSKKYHRVLLGRLRDERRPEDRAKIVRAAPGTATKYAGNRAWDRANPEKRRAHKAVELALLGGRLERKPCERCGASNSHAHHDDYSFPLSVMWLCPLHHKQRHKELAEQSASTASASIPAAVDSALLGVLSPDDWRGGTLPLRAVFHES